MNGSSCRDFDAEMAVFGLFSIHIVAVAEDYFRKLF